MVTRTQVRSLYNIVLRRAPESEAAVDQWLSAESFETLLEMFLASSEYKTLVEASKPRSPAASPPLIWPQCKIETSANPATLERIFQHIKADWTVLGENDPFYSVLSTPEFFLSNISENREAFFESGSGDLNRLLAFAARADVALPTTGTCLELGCGVGRLTQRLARLFHRVKAVDISASHLELARTTLSQQDGLNSVDFFQLQNTEGYRAPKRL